MKLLTFGTLELHGKKLTNKKALLLLTLITVIEPNEYGHKREYVAQMIWPETRNPRDNLNTTLSELKNLGIQNEYEGNDKLSLVIDSDVTDLNHALDARNLNLVVDIYKGDFLHHIELDSDFTNINEALKEQIQKKRDFYHTQVWLCLLDNIIDYGLEGIRLLAKGFEKLDTLPSSDEHLLRLYCLLQYAQHPLANVVEMHIKEMKEGLGEEEYDDLPKTREAVHDTLINYYSLEAMNAFEEQIAKGETSSSKGKPEVNRKNSLDPRSRKQTASARASIQGDDVKIRETQVIAQRGKTDTPISTDAELNVDGDRVDANKITVIAFDAGKDND